MHESSWVSLGGSAHRVNLGGCCVWEPLRRSLPKSLCTFSIPEISYSNNTNFQWQRSPPPPHPARKICISSSTVHWLIKNSDVSKKFFLVLEGYWGHKLLMESKYLPGSQNSLQDVISTPPLWLAVTLVELVTRLDGDKKAKVSSGQNLHFCLQKMTAMDKRHASSPRLICLIKNCKAGTALQDGTGSLFCTIKRTDREEGQMVAQQQKFSKAHFLPWDVLDWQLWKQVFYLSTGQDREGI